MSIDLVAKECPSCGSRADLSGSGDRVYRYIIYRYHYYLQRLLSTVVTACPGAGSAPSATIAAVDVRVAACARQTEGGRNYGND